MINDCQAVCITTVSQSVKDMFNLMEGVNVKI